jgi:5-formyltetrahydrofolate cyclo-ligase
LTDSTPGAHVDVSGQQGERDIRMDPPEEAKRKLRARLLNARRELTPEQMHTMAAALCDRLLATSEVRGASTVTAYVSIGTEPGTAPLLRGLLARGVRVLLPVLRADFDLDWAEYERPGVLQPAARGLLEPVTPRLGVDAVRSADVAFVPGLAVSRAGVRLGRGGGSYDRVLSRVSATCFTVVLLYDGEVLDSVPAAVHDRLVHAAATPTGIIRLGRLCV